MAAHLSSDCIDNFRTTHRIFRKLLMKLGRIKGKKADGTGFLRKSHFRDNAQNTPKIGFFGFWKNNS